MLNNSTENINITAPSLSWWHFWGVWVLISIAGWVIAGNLWGSTILFGIIAGITFLLGQPARHFFDGNIILFGVITGIAQWMLLRKHTSFWWIVATAISFPIGFELGFFVSILSFFTEPTEMGVASTTLIKVIGAALGGLIVGISQWVVLKQRTPQARWWIWAVLLGWVMGLYLMFILPTIITTNSTELYHIINTWEAQFFVEVLVFNVIFSLFTGFALVWLLYQPAPNKIISLTPQGLRSLSIIIGSGLVIFLGVTYFQGPQTIVSAEEAPDSQWFVSPEGDKLIYKSFDTTTTLLFPPSDQKYPISDCDGFRWLNNTRLICLSRTPDKSSLVDVADLQRTGELSRSQLKEIPLEQFRANQLITGNETFYLLSKLLMLSGVKHLLLIVTPGNQDITDAYLITGIQNLDSISDINYKELEFTPQPQITSEAVYSPNGKYYYRLDVNKLAIYSQTDNLLSPYFCANRR